MEKNSKKNKKVNILLVAYNAEKFIDKTLKSCLNQTYGDFDILILDNNSDDRTVEVIRGFNNSRIKLFEGEKNIGPYAGLNFLISKADGEFIAIQDHDDVWFPTKIEKQVEFLSKNDDFVACGTNIYYYYEKDGELFVTNKGEIVDYVNHTSLMFRNNDFHYDTDFVLADEYFEKKILKNWGKIYCIQKPLTVHRIRSDYNNFSSSRFKLTWKNFKDFFIIHGLSIRSTIYFVDLNIRILFPDIKRSLGYLLRNRKIVILKSDFEFKNNVEL